MVAAVCRLASPGSTESSHWNHLDVKIGRTLALLGPGTSVSVTSDMAARFILVGGKPFSEPVARYGPFVMNTADEIKQAIMEFQAGRFQV